MAVRVRFVAMLWLTAVALIAAPGGAARLVRVQIEPAQPIRAISIRSGDNVTPVAIRDGVASIPEAVPFPWTLASSRFESITYTRADFDAQKPLILRELGKIRGTITRSGRQEVSSWILHKTMTDRVEEVEFTPAPDGSFEIPVAAGTYEGAILARSCATRIRSAMVVQPARSVDIGKIVCDPAVALSFRVVDAQSGTPLIAAKVSWDPPETPYSNVARLVYQQRWTGVTNRAGVVSFAAVGPIPIPVRWRIESDGYAIERTRPIIVTDAHTSSLPDVRVRPRGFVVAHVEFPADPRALAGASLILGDPKSEGTDFFKEAARMPLREGDVRFAITTYGRKRLWVESSSGRKLAYRNFDAKSPLSVVDFRLAPVRVHGSVRKGGEGVEGTVVTVAAPRDASMVLGRALADPTGSYSLDVFASGEVLVYATPPHGSGTTAGMESKTVNLDNSIDEEVDLELPESGAAVTVVDARTDAPVKARVDEELVLSNGRREVSSAQTDAHGQLHFVGYPDGMAKLTIRAAGYRSRQIEVPLRADAPDLVVRLNASAPATGRVVDVHGAPIAGATVVAGFDEARSMPRFEILTDGSGRFSFDSAPDPGTPFYVAATGYALGIGELQDGRENTIALSSPHPGFVYLLPNNAPPSKRFVVAVAPEGEGLVPLYALASVAEANGITQGQLQGTATDGAVVLPEFLPDGRYTLFVLQGTGGSMTYQKVGSIVVPVTGNIALAYKTP